MSRDRLAHLFKAKVLSDIEYRTAAVFRAGEFALSALASAQDEFFLHKLGLSTLDAAVEYRDRLAHLFKAKVLSDIEYRTAAVFRAGDFALSALASAQDRFFCTNSVSAPWMQQSNTTLRLHPQGGTLRCYSLAVSRSLLWLCWRL